MNSLNWYFNLYYKFRDYPINELNNSLKQNQLKAFYASMLRKIFTLFQLEHRKDGQIQGLISKNNYDLMLNKKAQNNLAQEEVPPEQHQRFHPTESQIIDEENRQQQSPASSNSSIKNTKSISECSRESKLQWVVELSPLERNMDVFYELMIKMIRASFRRLMIQNFALDRYGMHISKEAIKDILQANVTSEFDVLKDYNEPTPQNEESNEQTIQTIHYPPTTEQMKFQFLKYCISSKAYNNPRQSIACSDSLSSLSAISSQINVKTEKAIGPVLKEQQQEQVKKLIPDNEIQDLIVKVSEGETSLFNKVIGIFEKELKQNEKNKNKVLGVKHIAQSILDFAFKEANNASVGAPLMFENSGKIAKNFSKEEDSLSNSNILLETWFDLILFKESPSTLLEIIEQLVKMEDYESYMGGGETKKTQNQSNRPENKDFYFKVSSYLHLLILNSTKNIFIQSLLKINYLLVLVKEVIGGSNGLKRPFKEIFFKQFEQTIDGKSFVYDNILFTHDARHNKNIWKEQAMTILLGKWKIIAKVITELCAKDKNIFFVAVFEKCAALLDKQLSAQVELIEKLLNIAQNIELQTNLPGNHEKAKHTVRALTDIIQEIIGFGHDFGGPGQSKSQQRYMNINNIVNSKSEVDRYRESSFSNREEAAEELPQWNQVITQNIFVYKQYKNNLQTISHLFKSNHVYVAMWFTRFHSETKLLVRKLPKHRLLKIFTKFHEQMPSLWSSMTTDNDKPQHLHSRFRRERGKLRNRISSIKLDKNLKIIEKKAIVLNYMLKAELQLYSHYMLIDHLNNQKQYNELFDRDSIEKPVMKSRPDLFSHPIIKKMILFENSDRRNTLKLENSNVTSYKRRPRKHLSSRFEQHFSFAIEDIKTMNNIKKKDNSEFQDLLNAVHHFERPMDLELDLDDNWKERFGEQQIEYLSELNDYIRYLNEINYLYELWGWQQNNQKGASQKTSRYNQKSQYKPRVELLNGSEYQADLNEIDSAFSQINQNNNYLEDILMGAESGPILHKEQLSEMLKRLKVHNKELYMIIEAIIEGENYFKLIGSNLIGRDKNATFKTILEDIILCYQTNQREKTNVKMLDKLRQSMKFEGLSIKKESGLSHAEKQSEQKQSLPEFNRKASKKGAGTLISHFEFVPEYYKVQANIFRVNCINAALEVDNQIYRNIKHSHILSDEKVQKLTIIGSPYYEKVESLLAADKVQSPAQQSIGEDALLKAKTIYEKKLLVLLITIINMNYSVEDRAKRFTGRSHRHTARVQFSNIPEEHLRKYPKILGRYTDLLKKYLFWRVRENIKRVEERDHFQQLNSDNDKKQDFNICSFLEEVLELSEKNEFFGEQLLLLRIQELLEEETNLKFSEEFRKTMEDESASLQLFSSQDERVEFLRKKLSYLLMRQMYFTLNYENDFMAEKSVNAKKNYKIYEERIINFFGKIIELDYQDYTEKKEQQIKKRSIHLKDYEFKYEQQPNIVQLQTQLNQLLCCVYNQLLNSYTTKIEQRIFSQPHKPKQRQVYRPSNIYTNYCASQYYKENHKATEVESTKNYSKKKVMKKESISSIFAQIFFAKQDSSEKQMALESGVLQEIQNAYKSKVGYTPVLIYTTQKFELSETLQIYFKILGNYEYSYSNSNTERARKKYFHHSMPSLLQEPIHDEQVTIMKENQGSLICLLKEQFLENIYRLKCQLIKRNLVSGVERLYIDLDVRHKVFQSFKDRILNYELQKAKIYHQYMDYIRGLKLDVYSHMAGQDPVPYLRAMQAVKLYRLNVKRNELKQRVNRQFQKNLQKWNKGIQSNLQIYSSWLQEEQSQWLQKQSKQQVEVNNLMDIYHVIVKQTQRQQKLFQKRAMTANKAQKKCENLSRVPSMIEDRPLVNIVAAPSQSVPTFFKKIAYPAIKCKQTTFSKYIGTQTSSNFKCSATESTKQGSKYEKITLTSHTGRGLRGISMKYDMSNVLVNKDQQDEVKKRKTQAFSRSGIKLGVSGVLSKGVKRYQSAQKFRPM